MSRDAFDEKTPLNTALHEACVGLFIAIMISALIFISPLAYLGGQLSQKLLLVAAQPGGALGDARETGSPADRIRDWYFVDLGPNFCGGESGKAGDPPVARCPPALQRTDRIALANLVASIRKAGPRVVVLDIATPPIDNEGNAALKTAIEGPGAPLLLSWAPQADEVAGSNESQIVAHPDRFICDPSECAKWTNARYLPALRAVTGPWTLKLDPSYIVELDTGEEYRRSGIALGAALVAASPRGKPWSLLDRFGRAQSIARASEDCRLNTGETCLELYRKTDRVFSFAPVAPGRESDTDGYGNSRGVVFHHATPDAGPTYFWGMSLTNAVVVIGDSRQAAGDRTWSAVGQVSGAELILNDIRQYLLSPPSPPGGVLSYLTEELPFFAAGFFAIFIVHWLVARHFRASAPPRLSSISTLSRSLLRTSTTMLLVIAATSVSFAALLWVRPVEPGSLPDIVTPFFAIAFESIFEVMHRSTLAVHSAVEYGLDRLLRGKMPI
ncbi:MAG TPA: CHASE2 domain-containing protein [Rhizomicrobium sp.]